MVLGLDIDGVVADFLSDFLLVLEKRIGRGPITAESITSFNFSDHPVLTKKAVRDCMEMVSYDPLFWSKLSSLITPLEWKRLAVLSYRGELVFITQRHVRTTYDIHGVTCDWLKLHGVNKPVVHCTPNKKGELVRNLGIQLFVDDRYENCREVAENSQAIVLMPNRPYNRSFQHPGVNKIQNFSEIFAHLDLA